MPHFYMDQLKSYSKKPSGKQFAHLITTGTKADLLAFLKQIGVGTHFIHTTPYLHADISQDHYSNALNAGCQQTTSRELIKLLRK